MYPLKNGAIWPRNQWYIAGFSKDFAETPIERTILGERLLLFRSEAGAPVALAGLCPHRFMPLVSGARTGDQIECPYHGMTFDASGACTHGPAHANVGGTARLKRFAVIEQGPLVWVWMGNADDADPALMPDTAKCGIDKEGWRVDPSDMLNYAARYMLIIDNLFDLSHIAWVHQSIVGHPTICETAATVSRTDSILTCERREVGPLDDFNRFLFPEAVGPVEQILSTEFLSVGLITALGPAFSEAADSPIAGKQWGQVHFIHGITPETATTTNLYALVARNFRLDDDALSAAMRAQNLAVLAQDREISRQIEEALSSADTSAELSFKHDHGGIEARRLIQSLIDAET